MLLSDAKVFKISVKYEGAIRDMAFADKISREAVTTVERDGPRGSKIYVEEKTGARDKAGEPLMEMYEQTISDLRDHAMSQFGATDRALELYEGNSKISRDMPIAMLADRMALELR